MNQLNLHICSSVEDAASKFNYKDGTYTGLGLQAVVVVPNGTTGGKSTMDLQLVGEDGKKYVALVTTALIRAAVKAADGLEAR